jgi:hypothetical protein
MEGALQLGLPHQVTVLMLPAVYTGCGRIMPAASMLAVAASALWTWIVAAAVSVLDT